MMGKSKLGVIVLVAILLTSLSVAMVAAQYSTQKTTDITIGSDGTFTAQESTVDITYTVTGTVGATGSVTASLYDGNPQSSATIPTGVSLSHFVVITFNMSAHDFISAQLVLTYSDVDVQNINAPFYIYKWDVNSNSYVELPSTVDTSAKTITFTLSSLNDPLLAIGGATRATSNPGGGSGGGISGLTWAIIISAIIIIVLVAVFTISVLRKPSEQSQLQSKNTFKFLKL